MKNDVLCVTNIFGCQGKCGSAGTASSSGQDGEKGKSAYEIWLDSGNTGSEQDFLASLKGEKGEPGADGQDGQMLSVEQLPEKTFEKGSMVLAVDSSGNLYRVKGDLTTEEGSTSEENPTEEPSGNEESNSKTDVDVAIHLSRSTSIASENETEHKIEAKIVNETPDEVSSVKVVLSGEGGGSLRDFVVWKPDNTTVTEESEGTYLIHNLAGQSEVTIEFKADVFEEFNVVGNITVEGDSNTEDNHSTLALTHWSE